MRFSITAVLALAAGAIATDAITETVTEYTTYCPEATSIVHGSSTYHVPTPGHVTMTGHYTVTRPLITSTVTECKKCSSSTPLPSTPVVSPSSSPAVLTSTPYVPTGAGPTGTSIPGNPSGNPSGTGSSPASTTQPAFNAGVNNVAGAGAGLAAVFGAVALLL